MASIDLGRVVGETGATGARGAKGATGATGATGPNQITTSTTTTLNGILRGNYGSGNKVGVELEESAPAQGSTRIVRSGGIYNALQLKINPNLIDNWYFVGGGSQLAAGKWPINHRGQTIYQGAVWGIDRWLCNGTYSKMQLASDGLIVSGIPNEGEPQAGYVQQLVDWEPLKGKQVTFSVLYKYDGALALATKTGTVPTAPPAESYTSVAVVTNLVTNGAGCGFYVHANGYAYAQVGAAAGSTLKVIAVKLELGNQQTLAQQTNNVWSQIDAPDYDEQLLKCYTNKASAKTGTSKENTAYRDVVTGTITAAGNPLFRCYQEDGTAYQLVFNTSNNRLSMQMSSNGGESFTTVAQFAPIS